MCKRVLLVVLLVVLSGSAVSVADELRAEGQLAHDAVAFLNTYCLKCHQGDKPKAKLDLSRFQTVLNMTANPKTWNRIFLRVL